jgi:sugar/nucleoside kinase (ribokinase family)
MDKNFVNEWSGARQAHRVIVGGICEDSSQRLRERLKPYGKNVMEGPRTEVPGGGAANGAVVHRVLAPEARITLLAQVGDDQAGRGLQTCMAGRDIGMPLPPVDGARTSTSFIVTEGGGKATVFTDLGVRGRPIPQAVIERTLAAATACCLVAHAVNEQIAPILATAARHAVPAFFGIGSAQLQLLGYEGLMEALEPGVEVVFSNRSEAERLTGSADLASQLEALEFGGRARTVVITDGERGLHARRAGRTYHQPAYRDPACPVVDDVGAGDAAQATIVDLLLRGYPLESALAGGARQGFEACLAFGPTTRLLNGTEMRAYLDAVQWQKAA